MWKFVVVLLILLFSTQAHGAEGFGGLLSPGELSKAHEEYEGLRKCVLCHKLGGGVPDKLCLDCHDKLAARLKRKEGVHATYTDVCIVCHTEHQGKDHSLVSLNEKDFDHKLTGYLLEGEHANILCSKCHKTQGVYKGQVDECISCHKDEHNKQLGRDCAKCHTPEDWNDASDNFDHDAESKFALRGKHARVDCAECHSGGRFKPLPHYGCGTSNCHGDRHKGKYGRKRCTECHSRSVKSWRVTKGFDHSVARFQLKGKHAKVDCFDCHSSERFKPLAHSSCGTSNCHGDRHRGQFRGKRCTECHSSSARNWDFSGKFDHNTSDADFALEGEHADLDCKKCHERGRFKPVDHSSCGTSNCHGDEHDNRFGPQPCTECHASGAVDWKVKDTFDHDLNTHFPLEGEHTELFCADCHYRGGLLRPLDHEGCGTDDCHGGEHDDRKIGDTRCEECHLDRPDSWDLRDDFDHERATGFELSFRHGELDCYDCHDQDAYSEVGKKCISCHYEDDFHRGKLGRECDLCHGPEKWQDIIFDHDRDTNMKLKGDHEGVKCLSCHRSRDFTQVPKDCASCHRRGR